MRPAYEFRNAAQQDLPAAIEIQQLVLSPPHKDLYANNILYAGTINAVAVKDGHVVGFISALIEGARPVPQGQTTGTDLWVYARPYIAFIGVCPDHQRQGIGTTLLNLVSAAIFSSTAYETIYLQCIAERLSTYKRAGFELVSEDEVEKTFHQRPVGLVMRRARR